MIVADQDGADAVRPLPLRQFFSDQEMQSGLLRSHRRPAPVMSKDEFVKVDLQLTATDAVIGFVNLLRQQVLNISETQAESMIEPNGMADDIRRESMSVIVERVGSH
jgi:hypothetical protein